MTTLPPFGFSKVIPPSPFLAFFSQQPKWHCRGQFTKQRSNRLTFSPLFRGYGTGIKAKTENVRQYEDYLAELKPLREELGVNLKEDLYPDAA